MTLQWSSYSTPSNTSADTRLEFTKTIGGDPKLIVLNFHAEGSPVTDQNYLDWISLIINGLTGAGWSFDYDVQTGTAQRNTEDV